METLRHGVLFDPTTAETAYRILVEFVARLAVNRDGTDRPGLVEELRRHSSAIRFRAPRSFDADIQRLKAHTDETLTRLKRYARIKIGDKDIFIQRAATDSLVQAAGEGHCLVIGVPGSGKSGVQHEHARRINAAGADIVFLSVEQTGATSESLLRTELGLEHNLVEVLRNWPGDGPGYLEIDGLDAARSADAGQLFRQLVEILAETAPRWHVVASIRRFDLRYADHYQDLFHGDPVKVPDPDPEFMHVRHLNVPHLTDSELGQAAAQSPIVDRLISVARQAKDPTLLELLRQPFNLRLAASLLDRGVKPEDITAFRSQVSLLDRYWKERVIAADRRDGRDRDRERMCRTACDQMTKGRFLRVSVEDVDASLGPALGDLLRDEVFVEWKKQPQTAPDRNTVAFSHNVLFDYAAARTLLASGSAATIGRIRADRGTVLAIHPSFTFHFQRLWEEDLSRASFWTNVLAFQDDGIPRVGQIIGPAVAVDLIQRMMDVAPLLGTLDGTGEAKQAAEKVMVHLAAGLVASGRIGKTGVPKPWCEWVAELGSRVATQTAGALHLLLLEMTDRPEALTDAQASQVQNAAASLFDYARQMPEQRSVFFVSAIRALCRLVRADPDATAARVRSILQIGFTTTTNHGLFQLCSEISLLIEVSPLLAAEVFRWFFTLPTPADDPAPMWQSQIFSLVSNLRQDFRGNQRQLAEKYVHLLERVVPEAVSVLSVALAQSLRTQGTIRKEREGDRIEFRGRTVLFREDFSHIWDSDGLHAGEPAMMMLRAFCEYLDMLSEDGPSCHDSAPASTPARNKIRQRFCGDGYLPWVRSIHALSESHLLPF